MEPPSFSVSLPIVINSIGKLPWVNPEIWFHGDYKSIKPTINIKHYSFQITIKILTKRTKMEAAP